jgi:hypothetical protein
MFMRARSLSQAAVDSIVQGILDVNAHQINEVDIANYIQEMTAQAPVVSTAAHTAA